MEVEERPIGSIKPYENNPRLNEAGVDAVAASSTTDEMWRAVPGYEGLYEVSTHGRVRRSSKSKMAPAGYFLRLRLTWDGYPKCASLETTPILARQSPPRGCARFPWPTAVPRCARRPLRREQNQQLRLEPSVGVPGRE